MQRTSMYVTSVAELSPKMMYFVPNVEQTFTTQTITANKDMICLIK